MNEIDCIYIALTQSALHSVCVCVCVCVVRVCVWGGGGGGVWREMKCKWTPVSGTCVIPMVTIHANVLVLFFFKLVQSCMSVIVSDVVYEVDHTYTHPLSDADLQINHCPNGTDTHAHTHTHTHTPWLYTISIRGTYTLSHASCPLYASVNASHWLWMGRSRNALWLRPLSRLRRLRWEVENIFNFSGRDGSVSQSASGSVGKFHAPIRQTHLPSSADGQIQWASGVRRGHQTGKYAFWVRSRVKHSQAGWRRPAKT